MKFFSCFFLLFLNSCGYYLKTNHLANQHSVYVEEIDKDESGLFKESIIKAISCDCSWKVDKAAPQYLLSCKVIDIDLDQIGYRYDRFEPTSQIINRLIPIEGRKKIKVEVSIKNTQDDSYVGPFYIEDFVDFDFVNFDTYKDLAFTDISGNPQTTLDYSLGQLDACEGAEEISLFKCYQNLAKKIYDLLQNL